MKKISIILFMLFIVLSMIHDLSKPSSQEETTFPANAAQIKVKSGDTVLSITEEINSITNLDIEKVITDFQKLNPSTNYRVITPDSFYYFPLYYDSD